MALVYFISNLFLFLPYITKSIKPEFCDQPDPPCPQGGNQLGAQADPDLTCTTGLTNHPCTLQATYNSQLDTYCGYQECQSLPLSLFQHNIFCSGYQSCSGSQISSYNDADCLDQKSYICCNGQESCASAFGNCLFSPDDDIYCYGYKSCYKSYITNTDDDIHCAGQESCAEATIVTCDDNVYCSGYQSCKSATITTYDDNIECCGYQSCIYTQMNVMEQVKCTASQACFHSTINFQLRDGDQQQTLNCLLSNSCEQVFASCINNMLPTQANKIPCTVNFPPIYGYASSYPFMLYANRITANGDPQRIYFYKYLTLRFQLTVYNYQPSEYYVLSLINSANNFRLAVKINSYGVSIEYGNTGNIYYSLPLKFWDNSFPVTYPIFVHVTCDSYTSTVQGNYYFTISGGYTVNDDGMVYINPISNGQVSVNQVIINSQPTYIAGDVPPIPNEFDFPMVAMIIAVISILNVMIIYWYKKRKKLIMMNVNKKESHANNTSSQREMKRLMDDITSDDHS